MSHVTLLVLDTSCSMRQKTFHHLSLLDLSKAAMERIIHQTSIQPSIGQNSNQVNQRRFLLSTCHGVIRNDIIRNMKSLGAWDLTRLEVAIRDGLKEMNKWRMFRRVDHFGQGRWIGYAEPSCIIVFTDKGKLTSMERGTSDKLFVPMDAGGVVMQQQWCLEPFRWDQKVFGVVLSVPYYDEEVNDGVDVSDNGLLGLGGIQKCTDSVLSPLCEVTGGVCVQVKNMKQLFDYVDHIVQNVMRHDSVVVNFDLWFHIQAAGSNTIQQQQIRSPHTSIFIHTKTNYWPIPESYFPNNKITQIPPRNAHPSIIIQPGNSFIDIPEGFPIDQYEIDPSSPIAQFLIQNKITQNGLYRCYIRNSGISPNTLGNTFGFVKAVSTNSTQHLTAAYFYILPYNYPVLFKLLRDFHIFQMQQQIPTIHWKQEFEKYCLEIPPYYINPLKTYLQYYLKSQILDTFFPAHIDTSLNYNLLTQITNLTKQEKQENELQESQLKAKKTKLHGYVPANSNQSNITYGSSQNDLFLGLSPENHNSQDFRNYLYGSDSGQDNLQKNVDKYTLLPQVPNTNSLQDLFNDQNTDISSNDSLLTQKYIDSNFSLKSPFEIHHSEILSQHDAMRCQLFDEGETSLSSKARILDPDLASKLAIAKHSIPIAEMGDYGTASKKYILRNPLSESQDFRFVNFGSPYAKKKKKSNKNLLKNLAIDEADAAPLQQEQNQKKQYAQRREKAQPKKKTKISSKTGIKTDNQSIEEISLDQTLQKTFEENNLPQKNEQIQDQSIGLFENIKENEIEEKNQIEEESQESSETLEIQELLNNNVNQQTIQEQPIFPEYSPSLDIQNPVLPIESLKRKRDSENDEFENINSKRFISENNKLSQVYQEMVEIAPQYLELSDQFLNALYENLSRKRIKKNNESLIEEIQSLIRAPLISDEIILEKVKQVESHETKFTKNLIKDLIDYSKKFNKKNLCEQLKKFEFLNVT